MGGVTSEHVNGLTVWGCDDHAAPGGLDHLKEKALGAVKVLNHLNARYEVRPRKRRFPRLQVCAVKHGVNRDVVAVPSALLEVAAKLTAPGSHIQKGVMVTEAHLKEPVRNGAVAGPGAVFIRPAPLIPVAYPLLHVRGH